MCQFCQCVSACQGSLCLLTIFYCLIWLCMLCSLVLLDVRLCFLACWPQAEGDVGCGVHWPGGGCIMVSVTHSWLCCGHFLHRLPSQSYHCLLGAGTAGSYQDILDSVLTPCCILQISHHITSLILNVCIYLSLIFPITVHSRYSDRVYLFAIIVWDSE